MFVGVPGSMDSCMTNGCYPWQALGRAATAVKPWGSLSSSSSPYLSLSTLTAASPKACKLQFLLLLAPSLILIRCCCVCVFVWHPEDEVLAFFISSILTFCSVVVTQCHKSLCLAVYMNTFVRLTHFQGSSWGGPPSLLCDNFIFTMRKQEKGGEMERHIINPLLQLVNLHLQNVGICSSPCLIMLIFL